MLEVGDDALEGLIVGLWMNRLAALPAEDQVRVDVIGAPFAPVDLLFVAVQSKSLHFLEADSEIRRWSQLSRIVRLDGFSIERRNGWQET